MYPKRNMIEYKRSDLNWHRCTNSIRIRVFLADNADYQGLSNTKNIVDEKLEKLTPEEKRYLKSASLSINFRRMATCM